ncbi:MAG: hypothetical protein LBH44_05740 [Treponema sp.]|jgi:hypothetical protein|nr:hypothetical protein [Treponema sp.]
MSKKAGVFVFFFCLCKFAFCESQALQTYKQNFSSADLPVKVNVLNAAAADRNASEFIGPLYDYALQFALRNYELLNNDPDMINLTAVTVTGLRTTGYTESVNDLWKLFSIYQVSDTGAEILLSLGQLGRGNRRIINNLNNFLTEQNEYFFSGMYVDYVLVSACIAALLQLGDSSSYPVLFRVMCAGFPEVLAFEALGAMELIPGNYRQFLCDIIRENSPEEKFAAFKAGVYSERFDPAECGQIAELALEQSLIFSGGDEENIHLTSMRYAAVSALIPLRWTRANDLAVRHYYRVHADYQNGNVSKDRYIESISLLGSAGNSGAALILVLQLGFINAETGRKYSYDPEITLETVRALGLIGDKAAYDILLSIKNLPYSDNIKAAAREAIDRLKW